MTKDCAKAHKWLCQHKACATNLKVPDIRQHVIDMVCVLSSMIGPSQDLDYNGQPLESSSDTVTRHQPMEVPISLSAPCNA